MPPKSAQKGLAGNKRKRTVMFDSDDITATPSVLHSESSETAEKERGVTVNADNTAYETDKPTSPRPKSGWASVNGHDPSMTVEDAGLVLRKPRSNSAEHGWTSVNCLPAPKKIPRVWELPPATAESELHPQPKRETAAAAQKRESAARKKWFADMEKYDPEDPPWPILYNRKHYLEWFKLKLLNPEIERDRRVDAVMERIAAELVGEPVPSGFTDTLRSKLQTISLRNAQPYKKPLPSPDSLKPGSPLERERERLRKMYPDWNVDGEDVHGLLDKEYAMKDQETTWKRQQILPCDQSRVLSIG